MLNFLIGQVMKRTGGKANPQAVRERLDRADLRAVKWLVRAAVAAARARGARARRARVGAAAAREERGRAREDLRRRRAPRSDASCATGRSARVCSRPRCSSRSPRSRARAAGDPPLARAERVALRVELWPLFRGQLEVASLAIDGLALHLVRTEEGLVLPGPAELGAAAAVRAGARAPEPSEDGGLAFGIRKLAVSDGALVLEDRSAAPATTWSVADVDLTATSEAAGRADRDRRARSRT